MFSQGEQFVFKNERLFQTNSLFFPLAYLPTESIQQPEFDRILNLSELLNQLATVASFHIGNGIANAVARYQKLRHDINLVFGEHLVNLSHDARYVFMDMDKAMRPVYLG